MAEQPITATRHRLSSYPSFRPGDDAVTHYTVGGFMTDDGRPWIAVEARYLDALEASHAALVAFVRGITDDWAEIHALLAQAAALVQAGEP